MAGYQNKSEGLQQTYSLQIQQDYPKHQAQIKQDHTKHHATKTMFNVCIHAISDIQTVQDIDEPTT